MSASIASSAPAANACTSAPVRPPAGSSSTYPAAAESAETATTASHISTTRLLGQPAAFRPLEDDMPSGRLDSATPASSDRLT